MLNMKYIPSCGPNDAPYTPSDSEHDKPSLLTDVLAIAAIGGGAVLETMRSALGDAVAVRLDRIGASVMSIIEGMNKPSA